MKRHLYGNCSMKSLYIDNIYKMEIIIKLPRNNMIWVYVYICIYYVYMI